MAREGSLTVRLRIFLGALVSVAAALGLAACTSTVAGTASYAGPTQTSEESTEEESTEEETTEEETTQEAPPGAVEEIFACLTVQFAYQAANDNFVALAEATNSGTPTSLTPDSVAADFDAAIATVQSSLDPLPQGPIRDAVQAAQNAAAALRDGLRNGTAVANSDLIAALDSLSIACEF